MFLFLITQGLDWLESQGYKPQKVLLDFWPPHLSQHRLALKSMANYFSSCFFYQSQRQSSFSTSLKDLFCNYLTLPGFYFWNASFWGLSPFLLSLYLIIFAPHVVIVKTNPRIVLFIALISFRMMITLLIPAGIKGWNKQYFPRSWHQNHSENRKYLRLGQEMKELQSRASTASKASGKGVKLVHNKLGEKWMVLELAAGKERGERSQGRRPFWWVMVKILHSRHGNCSPSLSPTPNMKSTEKPHENIERLGRTALTSEIISISGEQMEESGTRDASLNTGLHHEVTRHNKVKKKNFFSRTKISKMQYWTIQYIMWSRENFSKIWYTKMWLKFCVHVLYVLVRSLSWWWGGVGW